MRASALALLASGNSLESVAHVLGVPVETLQSWAARPTQALPADAAAPERVPSWAVFPRTATYAMGTMGRFAGFALVPLVMFGPVFALPFVFDGTTGGGAPISVPESSRASATMSVVVGLVVLAGVCALASGPIDAARSIVSGYPPLERLSLAEGTLTRVDYCHPGGKGYSAYLPITLATAGGTVHESVGCDLGPALRARDGDHRVSVWRDRRTFADGHVREVDMDGRVLQSYADYIARNRRIAPFSLLAQLMLMSILVLFGLGFILSSRED